MIKEAWCSAAQLEEVRWRRLEEGDHPGKMGGG
jgi:hypothetical protein